MTNYIVDFPESNNILYEHQYGFRKGHSTNHAVITLVERVAKALDTGKIVVGVYLDIRKAFDAIDHPILLRKLYSLEIRGNLYTWIKSYLTNNFNRLVVQRIYFMICNNHNDGIIKPNLGLFKKGKLSRQQYSLLSVTTFYIDRHSLLTIYLKYIDTDTVLF